MGNRPLPPNLQTTNQTLSRESHGAMSEGHYKCALPFFKILGHSSGCGSKKMGAEKETVPQKHPCALNAPSVQITAEVKVVKPATCSYEWARVVYGPDFFKLSPSPQVRFEECHPRLAQNQTAKVLP